MTASTLRYKWHKICIKGLFMILPTFLTAIFFGAVASAVTLFIFSLLSMGVEFILDIIANTALAHHIVEITHNLFLVCAIGILGTIIVHLLNHHLHENQ